MLESIVSYGLAVGAVYALIGITYNVMFTASRVFSFTAGMLGMLGGVLGALFITKLACLNDAGPSMGWYHDEQIVGTLFPLHRGNDFVLTINVLSIKEDRVFDVALL